MLIDDKTKELLRGKLEFSEAALMRLEAEPKLLEKTLKLIMAIKSPTQPTEVKAYAQNQLKRIRMSLKTPILATNQVLRREREAYYSFF